MDMPAAAVRADSAVAADSTAEAVVASTVAAAVDIANSWRQPDSPYRFYLPLFS
jgi:hypothetical protein